MNTAGRSTGAQSDLQPGSSSEADLWVAFKQDGEASAREKLFAIHLAFARQIANGHYLDRRSGDIEFGDLCQAAYAGLLEAIDHFDPDLGPPFRRYARRRIAGSVLDGIAKASEIREQISFYNRVRRERVQSLSAADIDRLPAAEAMQAIADLAVGMALGFMIEGTRQLVGEGEVDRRTNAYESLAWRDMMRRVATGLSVLAEREQVIIRHHYVDGLSFEQIGAVLGVTKGRVSQVHAASLARLRAHLRSAGDFKLER